MSGIFDQVLSYNPTILASSIAGSVTYKGTWDAATNSPTLANPPASTTKGWYYVVSVAGTRFGIEFAVGDWIISNGSIWQKVDLTDSVSSVFGRTGAVVATTGDYSASQISGLGSLATQNGTFSGTSSGTNTGDQSISITGDATAAASAGVLTATVTKINGTSLAGLATGILKNTTTTGVPSIAVAADFPTLNQNTTGTASNVTGTVAVANGGTGSTTASGARTNLGLGSLATQNGTFSGTSSGTNTGDQTISITGDVTASGSTGALTATVGKINGVALIGLGTGILKNSTVTGQPGIAVASDFPTLNQNTTGTASNVTGVVAVANGGTGASTLTGYVKGSGTSALTASSTIPNTDVSGLGTMSTQAASSVAITGGSINNTPIGASTPNTGAFTTLTASTPIGTASGGTGVNTTPSNGQVLIGNGTGYTANTLTAGSGITITNASGSITVAAAGGVTGVSSVTGTANEITATTVSGAVTLSLPSALTFTGKTITGGTLDVGDIYSTTLSYGFTNVASAGTVTTLTASSVRDWTVTGSSGQTYQLPDATTLRNGAMFQFNNNQSSGTIVVRNNSATTIVTIQSGGYVEVILLSNATAAGSWDVHNQAPSNVTWSTNTFDYAGSITSATWNGTTVAINRGGTGQATAQLAINALAGAVTSGSYLRGNGTNVVMNTIQAADVPTLNQSTTGSAATLTTPRAIYGNNFDGSAALTQVIASTYGGTGNGFTKFSGPTTAERTFTLPDSNATLLYSGGALGTPASGTVTNLTGTASININGTVGATTPNTGAFTSVSSTVAGDTITLGASSVGYLQTFSRADANYIRASSAGGYFVFQTGGANTRAVINDTGLNSTAIGATTASTGAFTTLSASGNITSGGAGTIGRVRIKQSADDFTSGIVLQRASTLDSWSYVVGGDNAFYLGYATNASGADASGDFTAITAASSTGLAVTGTLSSTTGANFATSSGNVGVGTTVPSRKFVVSNAGALGYEIDPTASTGTEVEILAYNRSTSAYKPIRTYASEHSLMGGNVGIGVTPSAWSLGKAVELNNVGNAVWGITGEVYTTQNCYYNGGWIYGATGAASRYVLSAGQHQWYRAASGTAGNAITFTQAMTLDASGNLLVGGTSASYSSSGRGVINLSGSASGLLGFQIGGVAKGYVGHFDSSMQIWNEASSPILFGTNATERARIDSSGNLLVGKTDTSFSSNGFAFINGGAFETVGTANRMSLKRTNDGNVVEFYQSVNVGTISITSSATSYNTSSDYRRKSNVKDLTGSGTFIDALKPRTFDWDTGDKGVGFIAHEFAEVSPSSVSGEKDAVDADGKPKYQSMQASTSEVIANLVAELQSLRQRVAALENS